jgi:signal transduction histidine kinase
MGKPLCVLIVEDSEQDAKLLVRELTRVGYDITHERVQTAEAMEAALGRATWDVVLADYQMPAFNAPAALGILQAVGCDVPFIIVSGTIGEETAVTALKAGAHDFLVKGRLARLGPAIERGLREVETRRERARLEEQLRHAQKMEAVGHLAGGIAHDFNNILTAILGYAELLTEQIDADKPIGKDLREIEAAAERAAELTRQLLAFSRKQVLAMTPVDLNDMVRRLEPMLRRLLGEQVTIKTALAEALNPVLAAMTQLEHVLINLSVNARDAMPQGGILTIETRNVALDAAYVMTHPGSREGSYAMVRVSDTGVGMEPEVQARIFEPFFTTKESGRGTGLGLAAVYGTVKQLHGYIEVNSQPERGSTFAVYVPRTEQAAQPRTVPVPTGSPLGTETVLLVEDEPGVRSFVGIVLGRFGYHVIEAATAEAALTLLEHIARPIHLLLTDVILPGMSGRELAVQLGRDRPHLGVLFMSGYSDFGSQAAQSPLDPGVHLIEKPFTAQALLVKVREVLSH